MKTAWLLVRNDFQYNDSRYALSGGPADVVFIDKQKAIDAYNSHVIAQAKECDDLTNCIESFSDHEYCERRLKKTPYGPLWNNGNLRAKNLTDEQILEVAEMCEIEFAKLVEIEVEE